MLTDGEISTEFKSGYNTLVQELNRAKLPRLVEDIKFSKILVDTNRKRPKEWEDTKKSKLIESLIVNFPIPPVIVCQRKHGSCLLIDGRQRLKAIADFYSGQLVLTELDIEHGLDGRTHNSLPTRVKEVLNRRSLSVISITPGWNASDQEVEKLIEIVIERLAS